MFDVLFVCYGNICRSPMAEALAAARLLEVLGPDHDVVVGSAGVGAIEGAKATQESADAMSARGIDLSHHRARRADSSLVRESKWIFCMEPNQVSYVSALAPDSRVELMAGGVEDPIGCGAWVYEAVAHKIERAVEDVVREIAAERGVVVMTREMTATADGFASAEAFEGSDDDPEPRVLDLPEVSEVAAGPAAAARPVRVVIGSDHAGYRYKEMFREHLEKNGYAVTDLGVDTDLIPADYTLISEAVARAVATGSADRGVIVAGSGNGEAIVANKIRGIRAAVCNDLYTAEMARRHNDANVLCVGQRVCGEPVALKVLEIWMETPFDSGRHAPRIANITAIENDERAR